MWCHATSRTADAPAAPEAANRADAGAAQQAVARSAHSAPLQHALDGRAHPRARKAAAAHAGADAAAGEPPHARADAKARDLSGGTAGMIDLSIKFVVCRDGSDEKFIHSFRRPNRSDEKLSE